MNKENKINLFDAPALEKTIVDERCRRDLEQFYQNLKAKIGRIITNQKKIYRVPSDDLSVPDQQYALLVLNGEKGVSMVEIACNANLTSAKWPSKNDINRGKRLCIEVLDWVDAFLLMEFLNKGDA